MGLYIENNQESKELLLKKQIDLCLKYSEKPEELRELLKSIVIEYSKLEIVDSKFNERMKALKAEIKISRGKLNITFDYFFSHCDAEIYNVIYNKRDLVGKPLYRIDTKDKKKWYEFKQRIYYSVLCDAKSNMTIPERFKDFCNEFGYSNDSINNRNLFEKCIDQKDLYFQIFNQDEIECLPS